MDMIERVARAMWEVRREKAGLVQVELEEWGDGFYPRANHIMEEARAAIEAMREEDLRALLIKRKFEKLYTIEPSGCFKWFGAIDRRDGYSRFYDGNGATIMGHKYAFETANGPMPENMVIDHICRNRDCVNPAHLRAVTNAENVMCGEGVTAMNSRKELCAHGHPLSGDNLYVRPNGERDCKICRKVAVAKHRQNRPTAPSPSKSHPSPTAAPDHTGQRPPAESFLRCADFAKDIR